MDGFSFTPIVFAYNRRNLPKTNELQTPTGFVRLNFLVVLSIEP